MGAPIHMPEMAGADVHVFEGREGTCFVRETAPVRQWAYRKEFPTGMVVRWAGQFAFRRTSEDIQIAYAGSHPGDIPRKLWREWFGSAHDLEFWNAARRELSVVGHSPEPKSLMWEAGWEQGPTGDPVPCIRPTNAAELAEGPHAVRDAAFLIAKVLAGYGAEAEEGNAPCNVCGKQCGGCIRDPRYNDGKVYYRTDR